MTPSPPTMPYGQRAAAGQRHDGWMTAPPRPDRWGQAETSEEWPIGSVVLLGSKNMFYTRPPGDEGRKVTRQEIDVDVDSVVVAESVFTENYRTSRWISIAFMLRGERVWTNVVREPREHHHGRSGTHYVNLHTQWGYRLRPDQGTTVVAAAPACGRGRSRSP